MSKPRGIRTFAPVAFIALAFVFCPSVTRAQIPDVSNVTSTPIPGVGHDYIHSLVETVNPANGSVSIRIAVPMPRGRRLTIPFYITYDSNGAFLITNSSGQRLNWGGGAGNGGWGYTIPMLNVAKLTTTVNAQFTQTTCDIASNYLYSDPSGGRHSLGLSIFGMDPHTQDKSGDCRTAQANNTYCNQTWGIIANCLTGTSDTGGEGAILAVTTAPSDPNMNLEMQPVTVTDADGTTAYFNLSGTPQPRTYASWIKDRNGNQISIYLSGHGGCIYAYCYSDTLGQTALTISGIDQGNGNPSNPDTIAAAGISGAYQVHWSPISTNYSVYLNSTGGVNSRNLPNVGSANAVSSIALPNGQSFQILYDSTYGLVSKIIYPSGGYVRYVWQLQTQSESGIWDGTDNSQPCPNPPCEIGATYDMPRISDRYVSFDGQTEVLHQTFSYATPTWDQSNPSLWTAKQTTVNTYLGSTLESVTIYNYVPYQPLPQPNTALQTSTDTPLEGSIIYQDGSGNTLRTVTKTWGNNPRTLSSQTTTLQVTQTSGVTSKAAWSYNSYEQETEKDEYDWSTVSSGSSPGALLRKTLTNYASFGSTGIVDRPSSVVIDDGGSNEVAESDYTYDGSAVASVSPTPPGHDETNYGANSNAPRGNLTQVVRKCLQSSCVNANTTYTYDETGQPLTMVNPNGNTTQISYSDAGNTNAFVTSITYPQTNGINHIERFAYNYTSGDLTSHTDQNGQITSFQYNDAFDRPTEVDYPDTGKTTISYNDAPPNPSVTTAKLMASGQSVTSKAVMDGLGHVIQTQLTSDPAGTDYTDTTYDGLGRAVTVSNPYRSTSDPTYGITTSTYDALNRVLKVTHPDGAYVQSSYTGQNTKVIDEGNGTTNVARISHPDALGRLLSVCEVSGTNQMGGGTPSACGQGFSDNGYTTSYTYDPLGNLLTVAQGAMGARKFNYDSLSRLLCSSNPEIQGTSGSPCPTPDSGSYTAGTIRYLYDANGNLASKIAPLPNQTTSSTTVTTTYQYDQLNRLTSKSYSDGSTPTASFTYDISSVDGKTAAYPVGRLVKEAMGSTATVDSYDKMGRVANQWQCTPQNCGSNYFALAYGYDLLGNMLSSTNGENVTLTYGYNAAAQLTGLTSSLSDSNHPPNLLSALNYNGMGAPVAATLGNGIAETMSYFQRGWLQSIQDGGASTPGTGTVTVSGSEQSQPGSGITPGTGSVVIGGSEQSVQIFTCSIPVKPPAGTQQQVQPNSGGGGCYKTVYDTGWVSITVNGFTKTVNYGQYSSGTTIANSFTTAFNGDSNSPVTASNTGATVYLTSKALGTAANYTLSSSANTNDPTDFGGSSFYGTPSGPTLTGGTNGPPTYDSGTVTVTVNGFQAPVSYGQSSTPSSIASSLATALSVSSSPVTATANGAVVTLTSKATGSSSNYSLSASVSGSFNPVSFAASPSGSLLTGGGSTGVAYSVTFPSSNGYAPNGDVLNVIDSVNGTWSYAYDDLNRLCAANQSSTTPVCGQPTQSLYTYDYDQYGNRWHQNGPQSMQLSFSGNSTTNNNRMDGYSYDAAGNLLVDNANNHYTYDAEGRIIKVVSGAGTSCYVYDAEGRRVRKDTGSTNSCADTTTGTSVDYLYDLAGHEITEVSSTGAWNRGEVYAGGKHVATYSGGTSGTTYFIHADWLGTERARTTAQGAVYETCVSLPFGDGLSCSGGDPSPMHFTGKQRDSESGLDDFGARYYSSSMGRWASPDWAASAEAVPYANFSDPQSLNLYSYVHNNPVTNVDADGHADSGNAPAPGSGCGADGDMACVAEAQREADSGKPPKGTRAQTVITGSGQTTINVNGTKVKVEWRTYVDEHVDESGKVVSVNGRGVEISAIPEDCSDCHWTQTVSRTGVQGTKADIEPGADPKQYPFAPATEHPGELYDRPESSGTPAGASFVSTVGTSDAKGFHPIGSITWGYSVNANGNVAFSGVQRATTSQQAKSLAIWSKATGKGISP